MRTIEQINEVIADIAGVLDRHRVRDGDFYTHELVGILEVMKLHINTEPLEDSGDEEIPF